MNKSTVQNKQRAVERLTEISAQIALLTLERERLQKFLIGSTRSANGTGPATKLAFGLAKDSMVQMLQHSPTPVPARELADKSHAHITTIYATLSRLIRDKQVRKIKNIGKPAVYTWIEK